MLKHTRRTVLILLVLAVLVAANVLSSRYNQRWDLTAPKIFTLSEQTKQVLNQLPKQVEVIAFLAEDRQGEQIRDLLQSYRAYSPGKFKLNFIDPVAKPSLARQYQVEYYNTLIVKSEAWQRKIEPKNMFSASVGLGGAEFRGEQALTRTLIELTRGRNIALYFLEGHGEAGLGEDFSRLKAYLEGEGYKVSPLNLAVSGAVPNDAQLLVIGGPQRDLSSREKEKIENYLRNGGKILVMLDPWPPDRDFSTLASLAEGINVGFQPTLVADPSKALFLDAFSPVPDLKPHEITDKLLKQGLAVALPRARSLALNNKTGAYATVPLLVTSPEAWGETNFSAQAAKKEAGDIAGPLVLAAAVERAQKPLAVVIGNSHFVRNPAIDFQGNADFFLNCLNWLLEEEELISIRPKGLAPRLVQLTPGAINGIFYGAVVAMPIVLLLSGMIIWLRRRVL